MAKHLKYFPLAALIAAVLSITASAQVTRSTDTYTDGTNKVQVSTTCYNGSTYINCESTVTDNPVSRSAYLRDKKAKKAYCKGQQARYGKNMQYYPAEMDSFIAECIADEGVRRGVIDANYKRYLREGVAKSWNPLFKPQEKKTN